MAEAIIRRCGGAGTAKVEFNNFSPGGSTITVFMPVGSKYKFGTSEQTATSVEITVQPPVTGYIKYKNGVIS